MKKTQKQIVYNIVKEAGGFGIRTEQVKRLAMFKGVSCPDRYCRYWQKENPPKMKGKYENNNKTKTWRICEPKQQTFGESDFLDADKIEFAEPSVESKKAMSQLNEVHQEIIDNITLKPLTPEYMRSHSQDIKEIL